MPPKDSYSQQLEAAKRASVGQLLFKTARLLNEKAIARVRRRTGRSELRTSHTALFPHIDLEGTRLTVLAGRLGVSKQAAGQLVEELEELGMVERVPDPSDGRAKLVRFTAGGRRGLLAGLQLLGEIEGELEQRVGAEQFAALHATLLVLLQALEADPER